jgi:hypothetical protein
MISRTLRGRLAAGAALTLVVGAVGGLGASPASAVGRLPDAQAAPVVKIAPPPPLTTTTNPARFSWQNATIDLPWRAARLPNGSTCPGGRLKFKQLPEPTTQYGTVVRGGYRYYIRPLGTADVNRDGKKDDLVGITCEKGSTDVGAEFYYVYTFKPVSVVRHAVRYRPFVLDYVTSSDSAANAKWSALSRSPRTGAVDVVQVVRGLPKPVARTFSWTRFGLVPNRKLPLYPQADVAPR